MADFEKLNERELENAAGGQSGAGVYKRVTHLKAEYLPVRNAPVEDPANEIKGTQLRNGDVVLITGASVRGTTAGGGKAAYVWVFVPRTGASGYVNTEFLV